MISTKKTGKLGSPRFGNNPETMFHSTDIFKLPLHLILCSRPPILFKEYSGREYPGGGMS